MPSPGHLPELEIEPRSPALEAELTWLQNFLKYISCSIFLLDRTSIYFRTHYINIILHCCCSVS